MNDNMIASMPLVENVPDGKNTWIKKRCPVCDKECWETDTFKWAKQIGIIDKATCTQCALEMTLQLKRSHDGSFSDCDICDNPTCLDGWCICDD